MKKYLAVLKYAKPYKWLLFWSLVLVGLFTGANIFFLPLTRDIVTELAGKNIDHINNQILNAILLYGVRLAAQNGQMYLMANVSYRILIDIRMDIYKKLQSHSQSFYSEWKIGDLMTRLFTDSDRVKETLIMSLSEAIPQIFTFVGIITYMMFMNWKLTTFSLITIPMFIAIIGFAAEKIKRTSRKMLRKTADINHIAQETLSNIKSVQACTMEAFETEKFRLENHKSFRSSMDGIMIRIKSEPLISFLQFVVIGLVIWYGGYEMSNGVMTGAQLAAFFTGILLLIDPVLAISKLYNNLLQGLTSAERIFELIELKNDIQESPTPIKPTQFEGKVTFNNVSFWYNSPAKPAIHNFSINVKAGEVIALVGPSGAGKSTIINLIPRFFDPKEGEILIDDIPIKDLDLFSLRSNIGVVPQEDVLFRGSILENVRYGRIGASDQEVIDAIKLANAWEFVEHMPGNIHAHIGDRGRKLSGGQKQRISIARALLRNPKILILDEATSALDTRSEKLVQDALQKLMSHRTTFVIAHRLSTITHANQIVVMEKGQIKEIGTHTSLLEQNGLYTKLYHLQFEKKPSH